MTSSSTSSNQVGVPGSNGFCPVGGDDLFPVDFLEGSVDLAVVMPTKRIVRTRADRK